jgi:hypothetical protein
MIMESSAARRGLGTMAASVTDTSTAISAVAAKASVIFKAPMGPEFDRRPSERRLSNGNVCA